MAIIESLKRAEVFLGLEDDDLRKIAALPSCHEETYEPGGVIFKTSDDAKCLYILEYGQVDLVMDIPSKSNQPVSSVAIDTVLNGGFFGWSALVKPHSRVMSAVSRKPSLVVVISGAELIALFEQDYRIGYRVLMSLSHIIGARLRFLEQFLATGTRSPFLGKRY